MSGWLMKAADMRSTLPLEFGKSAGASFSGSRIPTWQDSHRSTIPASGLLICLMSIVKISIFETRPFNWSTVKPFKRFWTKS